LIGTYLLVATPFLLKISLHHFPPSSEDDLAYMRGLLPPPRRSSNNAVNPNTTSSNPEGGVTLFSSSEEQVLFWKNWLKSYHCNEFLCTRDNYEKYLLGKGKGNKGADGKKAIELLENKKEEMKKKRKQQHRPTREKRRPEDDKEQFENQERKECDNEEMMNGLEEGKFLFRSQAAPHATAVNIMDSQDSTVIMGSSCSGSNSVGNSRGIGNSNDLGGVSGGGYSKVENGLLNEHLSSLSPHSVIGGLGDSPPSLTLEEETSVVLSKKSDSTPLPYNSIPFENNEKEEYDLEAGIVVKKICEDSYCDYCETSEDDTAICAICLLPFEIIENESQFLSSLMIHHRPKPSTHNGVSASPSSVVNAGSNGSDSVNNSSSSGSSSSSSSVSDLESNNQHDRISSPSVSSPPVSESSSSVQFDQFPFSIKSHGTITSAHHPASSSVVASTSPPQKLVRFPCNPAHHHYFHTSCLIHWLFVSSRNGRSPQFITCPICREPPQHPASSRYRIAQFMR
jgi:hypothetical protein